MVLKQAHIMNHILRLDWPRHHGYGAIMWKTKQRAQDIQVSCDIPEDGLSSLQMGSFPFVVFALSIFLTTIGTSRGYPLRPSYFPEIDLGCF